MDRRARVLPLLALVLGVVACAQVSKLFGVSDKKLEEAERRFREQQKECIALKSRIITIEEEYAFGGAVSVKWISQGGGVMRSGDADALHVQLNQIGRHLAAQSTRPHLAWTFGALGSPGVNAVSGPGGYVFVSDGLLRQLDSEAELAGVLAHEIAHITGRHALTEYHAYLMDECMKLAETERNRPMVEGGMAAAKDGLNRLITPKEMRELLTFMSIDPGAFDFDKAGAAFIQAITEGFVTRLMEKGFQERDEYVADRVAVELMVAAGYDPQGYITFLGKLPDKGLSTGHPSKAQRQERLRKHLDTLRQGAAAGEFASPVDLDQTKLYPLRDALLSHRQQDTAADTR